MAFEHLQAQVKAQMASLSIEDITHRVEAGKLDDLSVSKATLESVHYQFQRKLQAHQAHENRIYSETNRLRQWIELLADEIRNLKTCRRLELFNLAKKANRAVYDSSARALDVPRKTRRKRR